MKAILFLSFLWLTAASASSPEENLKSNDKELFEGDMKFLPGQARGSVPFRLWPNGVFVYDIESSLSTQSSAMKVINSAMNAWTAKTNGCITFKRRTSESAYVSFFRGSGCWSYVGRTGRKQQLSLARGCWGHGVVVHEIGHALGFLHEQSRPDRDNYVEIKFENIQSGKEGNFRKSSIVNSLGTPYDYGSIMHYGSRYFSKNGQPTIVPKKAGVTIGNRVALSAIDIQQMMLLYKCSGPATTPPVPTTVSPPCTSTPPVPTTVSPPCTSNPPPLPTTLQPSVSFSCNFDQNDCGFKQARDDVFDWTRKSGATPSSGTGPNGDHTSGQGFYMYIETSSPRKPGDNAKISRMVTLTGKSCLKFYYHMYGGHMGTLSVKLCDQVILNKSGNQGNQWKMVQVRLQGTGSKELTFEGIKGSNYQGDASIDDVTVFDC